MTTTNCEAAAAVTLMLLVVIELRPLLDDLKRDGPDVGQGQT